MSETFWFLIGIATGLSIVFLSNAFRQSRKAGPKQRTTTTDPLIPKDVGGDLEVELAREFLDDTSRGLSSLAHSVGSELANMASGVEGHAQLLCEAIGEPRLFAGRADHLWNSVRRLRLFSEKILSFARSEQLEVRPMQLRSCLTGLGQELESHSGNSINVVVQISEFLPPALASERQLRNALMFLVDTLFVLENRASRLSLRAYAQISEDRDTRVEIEMCAEADDPNRPKRPAKQAVQLGYLAARNLLSAQGATLSFKQLEGLSVSCFVSLQAADPLEIAARDAGDPDAPELCVDFGLPPSTHPFGGVLILEGEESIRSLVAQELEQSGRNIVACLDGAAARTLLEATPDRFEMILLEEEARLEDGISIARAALELNPKVLVLLLADSVPYGMPDDLRRPQVRILVKPFGVIELRDALRSLIATVYGGPALTGSSPGGE